MAVYVFTNLILAILSSLNNGQGLPPVVQSCSNYVSGTTSAIVCKFDKPITKGNQIFGCITSLNSISRVDVKGDSEKWIDVRTGSESGSENYPHCVFLNRSAGKETTLTILEPNLDYASVNFFELPKGTLPSK